MSLYSRHVLPYIINKTCSSKPIMKQREKIVPLAEGRVLEIGIGSGLNFPYLDASKVTHLFGLDTSAQLMEGAKRLAQKSQIDFAPLLLDAAQIPLEKNSVDTVLVTYSLCSIDALGSALGEMRRVLKPSGKLVFCEHGAAPDGAVNRWQKRITPIYRHFAGGCRLDRNFPGEIENSGFKIATLEQMYLPGTARIIGFNSWGTATPN